MKKTKVLDFRNALSRPDAATRLTCDCGAKLWDYTGEQRQEGAQRREGKHYSITFTCPECGQKYLEKW